jgi:hypothetical protein
MICFLPSEENTLESRSGEREKGRALAQRQRMELTGFFLGGHAVLSFFFIGIFTTLSGLQVIPHASYGNCTPSAINQKTTIPPQMAA